MIGELFALQRENEKLEARVKEHLAEIERLRVELTKSINENARFVAENSSMHKALERISKMGQQTKDGHRIHGPWTIAKGALRELDAKKYKVGPNPNYERDKNKRECKCGNYHCPGDC